MFLSGSSFHNFLWTIANYYVFNPKNKQ